MTKRAVEEFGGVILDVRSADEFGAAHIPNAINIGLGGQFATWAGTLVTIGTPVAIAAATREQINEAFMRLTRVGIESVAGFILMNDFTGEVKTIEQVSVEEANNKLAEKIQFIDVRRAAEHAAGHAPNTINLPLNHLTKEIDKLDPEQPTYVLCQGGYRSSIGTSILENAGFKEIYNVTGGTEAWIKAGFDTGVSTAAGANSK